MKHGTCASAAIKCHADITSGRTVMGWKIVRTILAGLMIALMSVIAANCTMLTLNYASLETDNKADPTPAIQAATLQDWEAEAPRLRAAFSDHVYGPWPEGLDVSFSEPRLVDAAYLDGRATLEETIVTIGQGAGGRSFHLVTAYPNAASEGQSPLIVSQTFSSNCATFPQSGVTGPGGSVCGEVKVPGFLKFILGKYIATPPLDQIIDRGYAYASFYASEFVPDSDGPAQAILASFSGEGVETPTGTLSAWAFSYTAVLDLLEADPRIDPSRTAVLGHSRHGKAALLAAVWDERIDAVLSHQSGFGGASLSRSRTGEGLKRITKSFPHWFDPTYAGYAGRLDEIPVDQHQLIALIAPTPVLLGNGRRDVWSDPNSSYRAAEAASPIYELHGVPGLQQDGLKDFNPAAGIAFHMRGGAHGVQQEDIDAFLDFLDAHFVNAPNSLRASCETDAVAC